ncbi:MAG: hypothetical protein M3384_17210, partial [Acidobacteriota bacterium]|nr:hypothetical protein [Acidobacteriota bacterium]
SYIRAIKNSGYPNLKPMDAILLAEHGIEPGYIASLRDAGYNNLSVRQLLDFAASEVTPDFVGGISSAGFKNLPPEQLAHLSVLGVTPKFIREAQNRLGNVTVEQVIKLKQHGLLDGADKQD